MDFSDCRAELIAVGSEILLGQISNLHAQTISRTFAEHGFYVFHHSAVGDNQLRIEESFARASTRSNVVIVTGGLGPTADDMTKEALASFLNRQLILSDEALVVLEQYFVGRNRAMPTENRKQALCVEGGELLANPNGTAPGQYIGAGGVHYFLLPGPPMEMHPMLVNEVIPRLRRLFANRTALVSRILHFCGIGESDVDEQIADLTALGNPTVAPLAGEGEMLLRITATAQDESLAMQMISPIEQQLRRLFSQYIYGVDSETLPSVVARSLSAQKATLAVAESCTGGLLAAMLTDLAGASSYFRGGIVAYSNEVKRDILKVSPETLEIHGAVSEDTAREMAIGVRNVMSSTYGLSVTGIAGPSGGSQLKPVGLVYGGIATPSDVYVYEMRIRGSREQIRLRAVKQLLWRLTALVRE